MSPRGHLRQLATLTTVLGGLFLAATDQTVVGTALPQIVTDLRGMDNYTWVVAAYLITSAAVAPLASQLGDAYGRRSVLLGALALFAAGSVWGGSAPNMPMLIIARAVQGLGAGGLINAAFVVIAHLFAPAQRGKYTALAGLAFGLASVAGPIIGGSIADHWSWRLIFWINPPACLVLMVLVLAFTDNAGRLRQRVDWPGAALLIVVTTPLVLTLLWGGTKYPWRSWPIISLFTIAALMLGAFLAAEKRHINPILPLGLFRERSFGPICVTILLSSGVFIGATVYLPMFYQLVAGTSAITAGLFLLWLVGGVMAGSIIAGATAHLDGVYFRVLILSLFLVVCALFPLALLSHNTSSTGLAVAMLVLGLGLGPGMTLFQVIAQNLHPRQFTSAVVGTTAFFRTIGGGLGVAVFGSAFYNHMAAGLARIPLAITNPYLQAILRDPNVIVTGRAPAEAMSYVPDQVIADAHNTIVEYLVRARAALADAIGSAFWAGLYLAAIAFALFLLVENRRLRSSREP